MRIPSALTAGDSLAWTDQPFGDPLGQNVDASAYSLAYSIRGPIGTAAIDVTGTPVGATWSFVLTPAQTAALNPGAMPLRWYWSAFASKAGSRITAGTGVLQVRPNLAAIAGGVYDGRSPAEQTLVAIEAEIAARITGGATLEYSIGSRSLKKEPVEALLGLRAQYRLIVSRERRAQSIAAGLGNTGRLGVRFR